MRKSDELSITPFEGGRRPLLREFHVHRAAREKYRIEGPLYALSGNVVLADLQATRRLAQEMNRTRDLVREPDTVVRAGDINAMGLIDEILHYVVELYRDEHGQEAVADALAVLTERAGEERVDAALRRFADEFPPSAVYQGRQGIDEFLASNHEGRSGREVVLEEMLMLALENQNPAFSPFAELFDDDGLEQQTGYRELVDEVAGYFASQPPFGPDEQPLVEMLGTPARLFPNSLEEQLAYMRERWGGLLGSYLFRLLRGLDVLREETRARFAGGGPGPTHVYRYEGAEPERFSPDRDWMPRVVLMAKSTLVWLDQLSRAYRREITRLDQIPDEELDRLAGWGFTGLWLIGLWERSAASRRIKNIMGNPEAEASAYALYDYEIAQSLGGWEALTSLRERCERRGIRLASDMVPNHTGIDGRWVIEHPDWFIQLDHPPFPGYTFTGENLSGNPGVGVYLEDHYYSRSDAAVVFRRVDFGTGQERFIYHGNDGTSMPWNDTAQLNYTNPAVREAVIETILHVARNFSVIRFDAAMTLAKRHIQRLWFPEPGHGGDIPSRAEHGMTADEFDEAIPDEFWREVVDRVTAEAPDTLLLAEAFWMMEGYFVRTLGMHRVYNSAFMNMLKNEENAKYRQTIKNTIEFDREILKRFVNFMNNPDEETAVAQFGTGDKYIGVCTLMVTMPGLPMFGHGQIEGFTEKYGMEYRRAYLDERPSRELVARHEAEIFPLMRRRHLFSGVDSFLLYDLYGENGSVNENIFAYSNSSGGERALVLYNNAYERAWGWIRESAGYVEKVDGHKEHRRGELGDALGLHDEHGWYCVFRNERNGLWFIRESRELRERGLFVELAGYQSQVFLDFYEVADNEHGHYAQLADGLAGRGVPDVEDALREVALKPLLDLYGSLVNSRVFYQLQQAMVGTATVPEETLRHLEQNYRSFLQVGSGYQRIADLSVVQDAAAASLLKGISAAERLPFLQLETSDAAPARYRKAVAWYTRGITDRADRRDLLATWLVLRPLEAAYDTPAGVCEEWGLFTRAARAFYDESHEAGWVSLMKVVLSHGGWWEHYADSEAALVEVVSRLVSDGDVTVYLGFNRYEGAVWYNKERFEELTWWLFATALVSMDKIAPEDREGRERLIRDVVRVYELVERLHAAQEASEYRVDLLLKKLGLTIH